MHMDNFFIMLSWLSRFNRREIWYSETRMQTGFQHTVSSDNLL